MRLKRYIEFIKESIKEDFNEGKLWILNPDDILEYFIDFEDEGYDITIELGFEKNSLTDEEVNYFTTKVSPGDIKPAYWIEISTENVTSNEDLTDSLKFAIDIIADKLNISDQLSLFPTTHKDYPGEITICDGSIRDEYSIDLLYDNKITIKGTDTYIKDGNSVEHIHLCLFIREKDPINITPKMMCDYYEWEYDYIDDKENIYADVDIEDMSDMLLNRNDNYKGILANGMQDMWDYYDSSNYIPDDRSFFQYTLDKENQILMVKAIIKEMGGLDEAKYHIENEGDDEVIEATKDMSEDELIKFLLEESYYHTLIQISNDSEIKQEIKNVAADWEMGAHVDENYESILSEFDDIVGKEFEFEKIEKEIEKNHTYTSIDSDGNKSKKTQTYKEKVTYYRLPFDKKWLQVVEDWDYSDMKSLKDLRDLITEYSSEEYFNYTMNPRISDWGSVDSKELNKDIKSYLTRFISN